MRLRRAGLDGRNCASSRPVVFCGMHGSKSKSTGKSGEILRIFPLSRIRNRNPLAFHPYIFFSNGFHWGKFISPVLARFKRVFFVRTKKRTNTLKGTGEKKAPSSRVGLKYRAGHCSTESSLRSDRRAVPGAKFARAVMLTAGNSAAWGKFYKNLPPIDLRRRTRSLHPALCAPLP